MANNQTNTSTAQAESKAGTGFMKSLFQITKELQDEGYTENISVKGNYFKMGETKVGPKDINVDKVCRYQNTSDPADSSIVYAISAPDENKKGLYIESHGIYHDEMSDELRRCLDDH